MPDNFSFKIKFNKNVSFNKRLYRNLDEYIHNVSNSFENIIYEDYKLMCTPKQHISYPDYIGIYEITSYDYYDEKHKKRFIKFLESFNISTIDTITEHKDCNMIYIKTFTDFIDSITLSFHKNHSFYNEFLERKKVKNWYKIVSKLDKYLENFQDDYKELAKNLLIRACKIDDIDDFDNLDDVAKLHHEIDDKLSFCLDSKDKLEFYDNTKDTLMKYADDNNGKDFIAKKICKCIQTESDYWTKLLDNNFDEIVNLVKISFVDFLANDIIAAIK